MLDQMNLLSSLVSRCCADRSTIAMIVNIGLGLPESGKWLQKLRHKDCQMVHATFRYNACVGLSDILRVPIS